MDYLALYRKYRPALIDEVVGQNEIKMILTSSVKNNTISHAYLFSGPRGTGKTTMAKIFAKMVNCETPIDGNPCNKCNSCLNLFNNNDVIEIDAASNNGVDEIRDLREKANLVPTICKYKIYIIDEVHMLTTQAFNALLKTLEEPPKHVIFILATTEYHKIPLTITSRCQKFQFNKIDENNIVLRLKEIANIEKIDVTDDALMEIAKISDGGMRDAINYLDQLRSYSSKKIEPNDVYNVCGYVSNKETINLFKNIKCNNSEDIVEFFERLGNNGKNYGKFLEDLLNFLNNVVLYKKGVSKNIIKFDYISLKTIGDIYSFDDIFYIVDVINVLLDKLKFVSRQNVVVISNFLLIMNKMCKINDNLSKIEENGNKNEKYEMAFDFTKENVELTNNNNENVLQVSNKQNDILIPSDCIDKDIIINNAFAVADKSIKSSLQDRFTSISDYLTNKKYSVAAGILIDTTIEVAGKGFIILTGNYDAVIDNIYSNYKICCDLINELFDSKYECSFISLVEWNDIKERYINDIKKGKKYKIIEKNNKKITKNNEKKDTPVDKLFNIIGEENIEFK